MDYWSATPEPYNLNVNTKNNLIPSVPQQTVYKMASVGVKSVKQLRSELVIQTSQGGTVLRCKLGSL